MKRIPKLEEIPEHLRAIDGASITDIKSVNHRPHPIMIGPRHVSHASNHHFGSLGEETLRAIPCAWKGCNYSYDEHTYDVAAIVTITKDLPNKTAAQWLFSIKEAIPEGLIDGFAFMGGKILPPDGE